MNKNKVHSEIMRRINEENDYSVQELLFIPSDFQNAKQHGIQNKSENKCIFFLNFTGPVNTNPLLETK